MNPVICKIRTMHPQQKAGVAIDGAFVIRQTSAVGRTDLPQDGVRLCHDLRNAEGAADFDQLSAGHDGFAAFGQGIEREQHRCSVVVDHDGVDGCGRRMGGPAGGARLRQGQASPGFATGMPSEQLPEEPIDMDVALAALAGREIEFEIRISAADFHDVLQGGARQGRPAKIGVKNDAGCVDDEAQRMALRRAQLVLDRGRQSGKRNLQTRDIDLASRKCRSACAGQDFCLHRVGHGAPGPPGRSAPPIPHRAENCVDREGSWR